MIGTFLSAIKIKTKCVTKFECKKEKKMTVKSITYENNVNFKENVLVHYGNEELGGNLCNCHENVTMQNIGFYRLQA